MNNNNNSNNSDNEVTTTTHTSHKSKAVSRILNEEFERSTFITYLHSRKMVRYDCSKCNSNLMNIRTKILHEIKKNSVDDQDSEVVQDTSLPLLEDNLISHDKNSEGDEETVIQ